MMQHTLQRLQSIHGLRVVCWPSRLMTAGGRLSTFREKLVAGHGGRGGTQ